MTLVGNLEAAVRAEAAHMLRRGDLNLADVLQDMFAATGGLANEDIIENVKERTRGMDGPRRANLSRFLSDMATAVALIDLEEPAPPGGWF